MMDPVRGKVPRHTRVSDEGLTAELLTRARIWDALTLVGVGVVLVGVFLLPRSLKTHYMLAYTWPTIVTAFTAHFIHLNQIHLLSNLLGYCVLVTLTYMLSLLSGRRTHFFVVFVTFLIALPFVLSWLNVLFARPRYGYGFSGILMAFLGFLPTTLLWFAEAQFGGGLRVGHSPLLFFLGNGVIAIQLVSLQSMNALVVGLIGIAIVLYGTRVLMDLAVPAHVWLYSALSRGGYVEVALAGVFLFLLFPFAAFPSDPIRDGTALNLFSHLIGYHLGYIIPYVTFRIIRLPVEG